MIWHSSTVEEVLSELKTSEKRGLSNGEALDRLGVYGPNRLRGKKKVTFLQRFFRQMKDFMVIILLVAAAISLVTTIIEGSNDWIEPIIIVAIVILNSLIGAIQESRAEASLEALKSMVAPSAKVYRDGVLRVISAAELVPGDVIALEAGDFIPADCRLIEAASLRSDESALTGESVPVEKMQTVLDDITPLADRINMLYSGCSITYGRGTAVVTDTGMNSEVGKIATLLEEADSGMTPLKQKLASLGKLMGMGVLIICAIVFIIGLFEPAAEGTSFLSRILTLFMTSVALAVAAIPEGLPAIVTVVLALGVSRMVKRNAIIRNLPAVETLGSASVICSDKTGTLTQNKMTVKAIYDGKKIASDHLSDAGLMLLRLGAMCCDAKVTMEYDREIAVGDPTETGIVSAAQKFCMQSKDDIEAIYPRLAEVPFDSDRKLMTTVNMINGKPFAVTKGAPEILMKLCTGGNIKGAAKAADEMGEEALRVIAVAIKPLESVPSNPCPENLEYGLTLVGLIGLIDPPRPEAKNAVKLCHKAGIRTVMITGDHITTASAIARQLGILKDGELAVTGTEISEMDDEEFASKIEKISVYARVTPEDKIRIVKAWQKKGHIVAMTGDGVNDAPALKAADIGCAMGITGTDVAKGAADMTLTDDNFATIVSAVREGRGIFDNIRKAIHYLISCNLGEVLTVFIGMLIFKVPPFAAIQLLWINLVSDTAPALALGLENAEYDIMERKPRKKNAGLFSGGLGIDVLWQGAMFAIITLAAYAIGYNLHIAESLETAMAYGSTMAFAVLSLSQLVHAFNVRSEHSLFKAGFLSNKYMLLGGGISLAILLVVLFTPLRKLFSLMVLNSSEWLEVVLLSLVPFVVCEIVKLVRHIIKHFKKKDGREDKMDTPDLDITADSEKAETEAKTMEDISSSQAAGVLNEDAEKPQAPHENPESAHTTAKRADIESTTTAPQARAEQIHAADSVRSDETQSQTVHAGETSAQNSTADASSKAGTADTDSKKSPAASKNDRIDEIVKSLHDEMKNKRAAENGRESTAHSNSDESAGTAPSSESDAGNQNISGVGGAGQKSNDSNNGKSNISEPNNSKSNENASENS